MPYQPPRPELACGCVWNVACPQPGLLARIFLQRMLGGETSFHAHPGAQALLPLDRSAALVFDADAERVQWLLEPGCVAVVPPRRQHAWDLAPGRRVDVLAVDLNPPNQLGGWAELGQAVERLGHQPAALKRGAAYLAFAQALRRLVAAGGTHQAAAVTARVVLELTTLAARITPDEARVPALLQKALDWGAEHCARDPSVEQLAQAAGCSASHLNRLFREASLPAPATWLRLQKLELAKALLTNPTLKTSAIAVQTGLGNAQYFSRIFKELTGETPRAYRLRMVAGHGA
jgi:AraC-like DNA-binding protein